MKRLIAILLCVLMLFAFAGCTIGTDGLKEEKENDKTSSTNTADKTYEKNFDDLCKCLKDKGLVEGNSKKIAAELIGAKKGVRYFVDKTNFVEVYEIDTKATPDEAEKMIGAVTKGEAYDVLGFSKLKGAVSASGRFVILYPQDSKFDYSKIIAELKNF